MGVPKQKWTLEEEAALKAGIAKYGPGRWSTILKDSEFASVLHMRSNVDLKDKWRNMNFMGSGYGSRQRARPAKCQSNQKPEKISVDSKEEDDMQLSIVDPLPILALPVQVDDSKNPMPMQRLESLILDSIANLKESCGSSRTAIAEYVEPYEMLLQEKHTTPPNFERLLKQELKTLIDCGKLIKVKRRYRMAPSSVKKKSSPLVREAKKEENCRVGETSGNRKMITKAEIDAELEKMKSMTPQQAAAVAMKAVAEAEAAILEAERAEREAQAAEADAELARGFAAAAAIRALKKTAVWTW